MKPIRNPAETLVHWTLILTWAFYLVGALYVVGPVLGWLLAGLTGLALFLGPAIRPDLRAAAPHWTIWLWLGGMAVMLVALWVGHLGWELGLGQTIKSTIGWAKGWALLAIFPLVGAVLPIRRDIVIRASSIVALHTLILLPLLMAAPYAGLPSLIFVSPLKAVGGPGPEYFSVYLYTLDPASWTPRWQFFAPWSPFAGLLGVLTVLIALEEKSRRWMIVGILAGVAMVLLSKSRMGLVALVFCSTGPRMARLVAEAWAWRLAAIAGTMFAFIGGWALDQGRHAVEAFRSARSDSTRVRETLQRIAGDRWREDAVWFGHGTVQPGPHLVEYMPIGSHHTWYGLLFVKGAVGLFALLVPLAATFLFTLVDTIRHARGRLPLGIVMVMIVLSFGENIEIEAYLLWPSLLILGIHTREAKTGA
jgi:uncharacterized membrane protein YqjE